MSKEAYVRLLCEAVSLELKDLLGEEYQNNIHKEAQLLIANRRIIKHLEGVGRQHENATLN